MQAKQSAYQKDKQPLLLTNSGTGKINRCFQLAMIVIQYLIAYNAHRQPAMKRGYPLHPQHMPKQLLTV